MKHSAMLTLRKRYQKRQLKPAGYNILVKRGQTGAHIQSGLSLTLPIEDQNTDSAHAHTQSFHTTGNISSLATRVMKHRMTHYSCGTDSI
jgi:hypothetical protein